jgi:glycosyltransferase involved in cell wall biosynthesis
MNAATQISVVVCSYNHASSLLLTLRSFTTFEPAITPPWELIVVDNNSTDDTAQVVAEFASTVGFPVRYAFEAQQGLSHARNCGMTLAQGGIVAFTDDDVRVSSRWLAELQREFASDPDIAMVCGRTLPLRDDVFPMGVKVSPERALFRHPCQPLGIGIGNNMAIRTAVAGQIGAFDVRLGAGTRCGAAEDTDYHDHDRTTAEQIARIQCNYRRGYGAFIAKHCLRGDRWSLKLGWWDQRAMWRALLVNAQERRGNWQLLQASWAGLWLRLIDEMGAPLGRR